jgi:hypothetical protein
LDRTAKAHSFSGSAFVALHLALKSNQTLRNYKLMQIFRIIAHRYYSWLAGFVVVLNVALYASYNLNMTSQAKHTLSMIGYGYGGLFLAEFIAKLISYGITGYFKRL